jgi:hypothetical protein
VSIPRNKRNYPLKQLVEIAEARNNSTIVKRILRKGWITIGISIEQRNENQKK